MFIYYYGINQVINLDHISKITVVFINLREIYQLQVFLTQEMMKGYFS